MSDFYEELEGPVARDCDGNPLTEQQIREINRYIDRINSKSYSYSYIKELHDLGHQSFRRAHQEANREKMDELAAELQIIDHILQTAFLGRYPVPNLKYDPKHEEYLTYLNEQHVAAINRRIAQEEAEAEALVQAEAEALQEQEETPAEAAGLAEDVTSAFYPLSPIPQVAKIQKQLERLVYDLRDATEDYEPPFIIKALENKIASKHEELEAAQAELGHHHSRRRYNPWY